MARQFGVATVTAREALEALRRRGLVETRRGRDGGSFVTALHGHAEGIERRIRALSRAELRDMGLYYTAIAGMTAELAADRATPEEVEHLRHTIDAVDITAEDATRRGEGAFRLEVAALSQSSRLVREELRLQAEFAPLIWLCLGEQEFRDRSRIAHHDVVDAIEALDPDAARRATAAHIAEAIDWLLDLTAHIH
jgi:DNA-binding FadR family transcriptional regulator